MEKEELLPSQSGRGRRGGRGLLPGDGFGAIRSVNGGKGKLTRQMHAHPCDSVWSNADVATAISRDLVGKAERWKLLAGEPMTGSPKRPDNEGHIQLPEASPAVAFNVDRHEVASYYVKDALAGRESMVCIHDDTSFRALKVVRNKAWNHALNVCTIAHLLLPMFEIQRCLPCIGPQKLPYSEATNSLHKGWRPTPLGSMWLECLMFCLYAYDLFLVSLSSSNHVHERIDTCAGGNGGKEKPRRKFLSRLPPWQLARTCMVLFLGVGLATNIIAHYVFGITWHRWSRITLPFLFISRRTYLKHFVGGMIRVLPRMVPVAFLMSFVIFFYAFLGYIIFRRQPRDATFLGDLALFAEPQSSALTFLRIFMSIPFMLDVEQLYSGRAGIQVMGLSYGVIMVIFLGALVPAVANRNFQYQSKESYTWVNEQRKLALTRAYLLLMRPSDHTVGRDDWVRLMSFLRPDCDKDHISALFDAAEKAESNAGDLTDDRVSKGGFFMLCALGSASFSKGANSKFGSARSSGAWRRFRVRLGAALRWSMPGSNFPVSRQILTVAVVVQGYQIVLEGDDYDDRPSWAYPLGAVLIAYFCVNAGLRMVAEGPVKYIMLWRHALGMVLNVIGVVFYLGLWFDGEGWRILYHILQASRLMILWNVLHKIGPTSSEVAKRLEFVFPAVLRASFVLFSVTYSYSVLAYDMYCDTPLGKKSLDSVADHSMTQRWLFYKDVISFESLLQSFASMTDIIMLSNWPIFMDAAADVGNSWLTRLFFYSFKGLTFYFVMPVMLGFIVQSYMAAKLPGMENAAFESRRASMQPSIAGHHDAGGGGGASTHVNKSSPRSCGSSSKDEGMGVYNSGAFGFSTLADGVDTRLDIDEDDGSNGDDSDDDDAPVMVTSQSRSMSQAFWGAEQAKDNEGRTGSSTMQGTLSRLENENSSLRALVDSMQMDLQMANARLYDELQNPAARDHSSSPKWGSRRGAERPTPKSSSPESIPPRKRAGSANSIGMDPIVESDEGFGAV